MAECSVNSFTLPTIALIFSAAMSSLMACGKGSSPKFRQYYVHGEKLYLQHCSNCHQQDGTGLGRLYPPVNSSDFMNKRFEKVICLMRHGIRGELVVNGQHYNQPMPGNRGLTDLEIAEIATYIYNTWGNEKGLVDVKAVPAIMQKCEELKNTSFESRADALPFQLKSSRFQMWVGQKHP